MFMCNGTNVSRGEKCYCSIQRGEAGLNGTFHLSSNEKSVPLENIRYVF